jgi:hypothetical protein
MSFDTWLAYTTQVTSTTQLSPTSTAVNIVTPQQMETLRDPIWQFVGAALALAAIFLSVLFFLWQRNKKEIRYDLVYITSLFSANEGIKKRLKVYLDDNIVSSFDLITIRVYNSGNVPILKSDYDEPIRFTFEETVQIYAAEVAETKPSGIPVTLSKNANVVTLNPFLMNREDSILVKIWATSDNKIQGVDITGRISGVKDLIGPEDRSSFSYAMKSIISYMGHVAIMALVATSGYTLLYSDGFTRILGIFLFMFPLITIGAYLLPNYQIKARKFGLRNFIVLLSAIILYMMVTRGL